MSFDQFLIDAFIARNRKLVAEESLRAAWQAFLSCPGPTRLSRLLLQSGSVDESTANQIDSSGDAYQQSLALLGRTNASEVADQLGFSPSPAGPVFRADDFESDQEYETLMEDNADSGATPRSDTAGNPIHRAAPHGAEAGAMRYHREQPHAEGGLGRVWLASDVELNRKVALKEIQPEHADEPSCRLRFTQEAEITGALEHPGIVPVYGLGHYPDGRPFYAMRFIEGDTLKCAIDALHDDAPAHRFRHFHWRSRFRKLLDRFLDVCNTIEYAHSKGVIHRDIKPNNIMLGAYGETLVVDWGLAKQLDTAEDQSEGSGYEQDTEAAAAETSHPELTLHGTAVGTPAYMSPEQAAGGRANAITIQTDVYSLGATLFHLLTGEPPSLTPVASDRVPRPRRIVSDIPAPLDSICSKSMAVDLCQRYLSAAQLSADIDQWLAGQPVSAHQESMAERGSRWIRNHPATVASSVVAGIVFFLASLVGVYGYNSYRNGMLQKQQERDRLAESHLQQMSSSAKAAVASAQVELRNSRFQAALGFLDNAIGQLELEPELASDLGPLVAKRDRTRRLLDFYNFTEQAEELAFRDSSRRASILFQHGLQAVDVFRQREWWTALPIEDLAPPQIHDLRTRVYRAMFLLTALRLKETIPADLDVMEMLKLASSESKNSNQASIVLFDLLDAYRRSQGAELGRRFATERSSLITKALTAIAFRQPLVEWKPRNESDLYVMGAALGYMVINTDEASRKPFESLLGITNAEAVSKNMLTQASELQRGQYWTQLVRAFFEAQRGEHETAWRSYSQAISLNPEHWVGYAWLGIDQRTHAIANLDRDDPLWLGLLSRSSRNLERAVDVNPYSHQAHYERGHTLTWFMSDPREALSIYARALFLQEPIESIHDTVVEQVDRNYVTTVRNWCLEGAANWNYADLHACAAWSELILGDNNSAKATATKALELQPGNRVAGFVQASVTSKAGEYEQAEAQFEKLCRDAQWYPILYARGVNAESLGRPDLAMQFYRQAVALAEASWQGYHSQRNLARMAILCQADDVLEQVKRAIDVAPTERLDELLAVAIQEQQDAAVAMLAEHHRSQQPIMKLASDQPLQAVPLLNGGFELGMTPCWGDTLDTIDRPAWHRQGGSLAQASVGSAHVHDGDRALHVVNENLLDDGQANANPSQPRYGELSQVVSVGTGKRYRLSAWFYSTNLTPDAIVVMVDEQVVLKVPEQLGRWQQVQAQFLSERDELTVRIRCTGQADTWVDSLQLVCVESMAR